MAKFICSVLSITACCIAAVLALNPATVGLAVLAITAAMAVGIFAL